MSKVRLADVITRDCYIMYASVHRWGGKAAMDEADVFVGTKKVSSIDIDSPRWRFLPQRWDRATAIYSGKVHNTMSAYGIRLRVGSGIYAVPKIASERLISRIDSIRESYRQVVSQMAEEWDHIVEEMRNNAAPVLGERAQEWVDEVVPKKEKLHDVFYIEVGLWPFAHSYIDVVDDVARMSEALSRIDVSSCGPEVLGLVEAARAVVSKVSSSHDVIREEVGGWISRVRHSAEILVRRIVEDMLREPVAEFVEAIDKLDTMTSCRGASIRRVREAYEKLVHFQFILPPNIKDQLDRVGDRIHELDHRALNSGDSRMRKLTEAIRSAASVMLKASEEAVWNLRNIDV